MANAQCMSFLSSPRVRVINCCANYYYILGNNKLANYFRSVLLVLATILHLTNFKSTNKDELSSVSFRNCPGFPPQIMKNHHDHHQPIISAVLSGPKLGSGNVYGWVKAVDGDSLIRGGKSHSFFFQLKSITFITSKRAFLIPISYRVSLICDRSVGWSVISCTDLRFTTGKSINGGSVYKD